MLCLQKRRKEEDGREDGGEEILFQPYYSKCRVLLLLSPVVRVTAWKGEAFRLCETQG